MRLHPLLLAASLIGASVCQAEAPPPAPRVAPDVPRAELVTLVQGNTAFGLDLYAQLRSSPGNLFFSPYSLSTALAMTAAGARGETARQMNTTLHLPENPQQTAAAFATLVRNLKPPRQGASPPYRLSISNTLWGQRGYPFVPAYVGLLRDSYGSALDDRRFPARARAGPSGD